MSSRLRDAERLPQALVDAWREDGVDAAQVRRAYLRFLRTRRPARLRASAPQVVGWLLLGVVIGMGSLYAATGPLRFLGPREPLVVMRAPKPRAAEQPPARSLAPADAAAEAPAPSSLGVARRPPSESVAAAAPVPSASNSEQWRRAARGLRERDFDTANAALEELARHGTSAERESAQLVQAQLLISQQRTSEAERLLRALQASARSTSVREKVTELLSHLKEEQPSQRSFAPAEGANAP